MPAARILVSTSDPRLRELAAAALADPGCEVLTAGSGVECLGQLRAAAPDLLVLAPPLLWGSVAGVLAATHEDATMPRVPVLILSPDADGPLPRVPRLFVRDDPARATALGALVDRVCAWARACPPPAAAP